MKKVFLILLASLVMAGIVGLSVISVLQQFPEQSPKMTKADDCLIAAYSLAWNFPERKETALASVQRLIDEYGKEYPSEVLINYLEEHKGDNVLNYGYWYGQVNDWDIYYPEASSLSESPLAKEIRNTPYEAFGRLGKIIIYRRDPEDGLKAVAEYQKLAEKFPDSQLANGALMALLGSCPLKDSTETQQEIEVLLRERINYLEESQKTKSYLEKWTLMGFYRDLYYKISGQELSGLKEKIISLTSPDDYYLWSAVPLFYPGPPIFDHREITLVIDEETVPQEAVPIILNAFQKWEEASNGGVKFTRLYLPPPYSEDANRGYDILVRRQKEGEHCLGAGTINYPKPLFERYMVIRSHATVYFNFEPEIRIGVEIFPNPFYKDGEILSSELYGVALHEIGHALGLPESYEEGDIMWKGFAGGKTLSQRDINTIRLMYH